MNKQESHEITLQFLRTFDEKGIYQFNREYYDVEFFESFHKNGTSISTVFEELTKKINSKEFETNPKDLMIFGVFVFLSYIISNLEVVKKYLKVLIKENEITLDENTTLGQLIKKICKKFEYSQKSKDKIFELFCVDFRNAIAHQHYLMSEKGITVYPHDNDKRRSFDIDALAKMADNVSGIAEGITEYIDNKTKELDELSDKLN